MKNGKKVTRNVWKENFFNGRKQFIFIGRNKGLTAKTFLPIPPEEEHFSDCIMSYTRKGSFQPNWTPTQEDMLAEDWEMYPAEETVVEFLRTVTWSSGVKNITGHQQGVDVVFINRLRQPVQKSLKLIVALSAVQSTPNMPVGCVKNFSHSP